MKTLPPGSVIGILGGGQLGRMAAMAAARLGYHVHIFSSDDKEPAVEVSRYHTKADFTDSEALIGFAQTVDVVTLEWENVPISALETIAVHTNVYPSAEVLRISQDRGAEKQFMRDIGLGTADFVIVQSAAELEVALRKFPERAILKSTRMGYDGKGQVKITPDIKAETAWQQMASPVGILEKFVDFACEVSVLIACRADGATATYPVVQNIHKNQILAETHAPAAVSRTIADEAEHAARLIAEKLDYVGLLAVEMFVLKHPNAKGQSILINEIAPRPHNSGHWTMDACSCSQFEQLVRAVCGLPLGSTLPHHHAVMFNLIGDDSKDWMRWLADPAANLHLYGKSECRVGRKMGHVNLLKGVW